VSYAVDVLRQAADAELLQDSPHELVTVERTLVTVPVLNEITIRDAYREAARNGTLLTTQQQLFLPPPRPGETTMRSRAADRPARRI
jgi:hypothetical protein